MKYTNENIDRLATQSAALKKITAMHDRLYPKPLRMFLEQQERLSALMMPAKLAELSNNINVIKKAGISVNSHFKSPAVFEAMRVMNAHWEQIRLGLLKSGFSEQVDEMLNAPFGEIEAEEYCFDDKDGEAREQSVELIKTIPSLVSDIYYDYNLLNAVDPRKFEEIVAELLHAKGFKVELTQQTNDGGRDIIALNSISGFPMRMLVECKRWNRKVGVDVIRSFCDVIHLEKPNKGLIVTTSYFTKGANDRKMKEGSLLDLTDRDELLSWVRQYHQTHTK